MSYNWRNGRKGFQVKQGVGRALEEEEEPGKKPEETIWSLWGKQKTVFNMDKQTMPVGRAHMRLFFFFLSGGRVGSKSINIGRPTWPCTRHKICQNSGWPDLRGKNKTKQILQPVTNCLWRGASEETKNQPGTTFSGQ